MIKVWSDGANKADATQTMGSVVVYDEGVLVLEDTRLGGPGWSDIGEYTGVILGLERLLQAGVQHEPIRWFGDSQFVMRQMSGKGQPSVGKSYYPLCIKARELAKRFTDLTFTWIPREQNAEADALCTLEGQYLAKKPRKSIH